MKTFVVLAAVFALASAETYKTTHDNLDVEALVSNPESLNAFTQCFLDQGECNEVSAAFRSKSVFDTFDSNNRLVSK